LAGGDSAWGHKFKMQISNIKITLQNFFILNIIFHFDFYTLHLHMGR